MDPMMTANGICSTATPGHLVLQDPTVVRQAMQWELLQLQSKSVPHHGDAIAQAFAASKEPKDPLSVENHSDESLRNLILTTCWQL